MYKEQVFVWGKKKSAECKNDTAIYMCARQIMKNKILKNRKYEYKFSILTGFFYMPSITLIEIHLYISLISLRIQVIQFHVQCWKHHVCGINSSCSSSCIIITRTKRLLGVGNFFLGPPPEPRDSCPYTPAIFITFTTTCPNPSIDFGNQIWPYPISDLVGYFEGGPFSNFLIGGLPVAQTAILTHEFYADC